MRHFFSIIIHISHVVVFHYSPCAAATALGSSSPLDELVFGLSIAFAASSFFLSFFSFGGGALV